MFSHSVVFTFLLAFLKHKEFLIWMKSNFLIYFIMCAFGLMFTKPLSKPIKWKFMPMLSSMSFVVLAHTVRFVVNFCHVGIQLHSFACCPCTTYWKDYSFHISVLAFLPENQLTQIWRFTFGLSVLPVLTPLRHTPHCCSSESFEIGKYEYSLLFFFKIVLAILDPLHFFKLIN